VSAFQVEKNDISYDSIYKIVKLYSKKKENRKALTFSRKLLVVALANNNEKQQAKSYSKIAEFYRKLNLKDSAFYYYNKSKKMYFQQKDSLQLGKSLFQLSLLESSFGSYHESDSSAVQTLKFLNGREVNIIAATYNCLAINSKERFLYEDAITYYEKALEFTETKKSKIKYKNNIAILYKDFGDYPKSISIFQDLLKDTIVSKITEGRVVDNLAYTKWLQNSKKNVLQDLLLANSMKQKIKDDFGLIASYSHLSDYHIKNNKRQSLFYAKKMYEVAKKEKATNGLLEAIDKILSLETPKNSIKYYKESIQLRDSLQDATTKRQYKFAKIKYTYEEQEKQKFKFKTLAAENKLIAEQENNQKKNIVIFLMLLTSGFIFYIYRRKQQHKKRVLRETYNTETRIAKKLHDELGNDVFNVLTKVQNSKFKTSEIVNYLDKIYLQTRAISHENDVVETGEKFDAFFRSLVANYISDDCKVILKDLNVLNLNEISDEKQIVVYRVFNELFVNMKKHSKASLVLVSCKRVKNQIEMMYTDNGIGFVENNIVFKNGLKNMEIRIKKIKGTVSFENKPDLGLKVIFRFKK
tara:strand:- start:2525 stop:4270 length:1746 start_codon:yes stop_codon:yes gene_type:complete